MKKAYLSLAIFPVLFLGCLIATNVMAYTVEDLNLSTNGSMIVGPGKTELLLSPGDTYNMAVTAANATGMTKIVKFTTEDIGASNNPSTPLQFMGSKTGPYSLKDFVKPESDKLTLLAGQRVTMPITITIPTTATPGGLYGAIMVSAENLPGAVPSVSSGQVGGQINIITRVAVLVFIRIKGPVVESSYLRNFTADKNFYEKGPVIFGITSENTGNVYLSPYGSIEVKDIFGRTIDNRSIDPWFVLPKSDRTRNITWSSSFLFGKYTAVLTLDRGYQNSKDSVDTKSISFWVIPWKIVTVCLIVLILVIWLLVWIFSHIQWKSNTPSGYVPPAGGGSGANPLPGSPEDSQAPPYGPIDRKK